MTEFGPVCEIPGLGPDAYARWRTSDVGAVAERLERKLILELAGNVRDRSVLDIGCGDGELAVELSKRGASVVGIDSSETMIEAAKHKAEEHRADIDFQVATAQNLPFPPEHFDVVVAVTVLCFVENAASVFQEIHRVLRPGGHLVIGELGKWSSWAAARRIRGWLGSSLWRRGRFRTAGELRVLSNQAGFVAGPVRGAVYFPRFGPAARLLAPYDPYLSRLTTVGAAFLAVRAVKPPLTC